MPTVGRWTGQDSRVLRHALRMTVREYAAYLGVSTRTVSMWEAGTTRELRPASQEILDTALHQASVEAQERFTLLRDRADGHDPGEVIAPDGRPRKSGARLPIGIADHIPELLVHLRE
jgi:transcriptional regulator with XRE-family HTH domain